MYVYDVHMVWFSFETRIYPRKCRRQRQADGSPDVGVYHEPECASSPSEPGCGVGDVLEGADETCRFCIVNRDNWLESNPGEESDW